MATDWEDLRKRAKKTQHEIELKMSEFSKIGAENHLEIGARDDIPLLSPSTEDKFHLLSQELDELLGRLAALHESMDVYTKRLGMNSGSAAMIHTLQRHRDILQDYSLEYKKIKSNITQQREREYLLSGSRDNQMTGDRGRRDVYLRENEHLRNADHLLDEQIGMALATKENLVTQRNVFSNITDRMHNMTNRFPVINNLMGKINLKKKRDSLILGFIISFCVVFILWWLLW